MPTTVRVEDDVKADLDRLQGLLQSETGKRLTHSQLLARLLAVARRHEADLYRDPVRRRPTADEIRKQLADLAVDVGPTDVADIDEVLYGERP